MTTRQQAGLLSGGQGADHGGDEHGPRQAASAGRRLGGGGRGGGHLGVSSGADETSGHPGGRAGHRGESLHPWPRIEGLYMHSLEISENLFTKNVLEKS